MSSAGWNLIRSKPGFAANEEQWVGTKQLGQGGQGCAGLFVKRDPTTQKIIERMVVKEVWRITKQDPEKSNFKEDYEFFGSKREIPREQYMSMIMPKDSKNTVEVWGHRLFPERDCLRLYMEYCPGGDLTRLLEPYQTTLASLAFPEPYLWKLFQDLARAVHAMDNPSGQGLKGDEFVAHIDFKPDNVFLCLPDEDTFPKYPLAKLADFGGAMVSSSRDSQEEHSKKVDSTATSSGYVAPDRERFFRDGHANNIPTRDRIPGITLEDVPKRVTSATNIWNAALIIADLMAPQPFVPPNWSTQGYAVRETWLDNFVNQRDTHPRMQGYSSLLKDTVIQCLNFIPSQRPTPVDLLARVEQGVSLHAGVMRTKDCLDTAKYNGKYDLDPSIPFVDDYPVTQPEDWDMDMDMDMDMDSPSTKSLSRRKPAPVTPHKPKNPRSITTKAGALRDTPGQVFLLGPDAGRSVKDFFDYDPAAGFEKVDRSVTRPDFIDEDGLRQAFEDEMG
ncbi:kinase-like protein, partial [Aureobasidium melanogenum]